MMDKAEARRLAKKIARDLFTDANKVRYSRLAAEDHFGKRNGGGWCESAVVGRIMLALEPYYETDYETDPKCEACGKRIRGKVVTTPDDCELHVRCAKGLK